MGHGKNQPASDGTKGQPCRDAGFYRFMIDSLPIAVIAVDDKLKITDFNPWAEKVTGYLANEATGHGCGEILRGGMCNSRCPLKKALSQENPVVQLETTIRNRTGETIPVRMNTSALFAQNGKLMGAVEAFQDISTLKALEREKENFVSMIAHDMKASLVVIGGFVFRILKKANDIDVDKRTKYLEIIQNERRRLELLLEDFLELSRLKSRELRLNLSTTSVDTELIRLFEAYRPVASEHGIDLELQNEKALPVIQADPKRLYRVFANLLDNAIKFSQKGDKIIVATEETDQRIVVKFIDHGRGIAPEELPYIFDPFHRGQTGPNDRGFGVGLAAVKAFVEAHGGWVHVESELGRGSLFIVNIPKGRGDATG